MKTRTANTTLNSKPARGPSLYNAETSGKDPLEGLSILGALDSGRSRSGPGRRGMVGLLIVLLLLPVSYLIATSPTVRQSLPELATMAKEFRIGGAKEAVALPESNQATTEASSPSAAQEESTATIVTEAPSVPSAVQEALVASATESGPPQIQLPVIMEPELEQAKAPEPVAVVPVPAGAGRTQSARRTQPKATKAAAIARARRPEHKQVAAVQVSAREANADKNKEKGKDKDVALIAALLTHISRPGEAKKDVTTKPGATPAASLALSGTAAKRDGHGANRDIVVQSTGESKESLIGRCRSLGFLEGELCRIRICSGSWGTDPACSMDSAVRGE